MEVGLRDAKARLSELIAAAENGERVVITKHGEPTVELVRFRRRGGLDFDKLARSRARLGLEEGGDGWPPELDNPSLSRSLLGLDRTRDGRR